MISTVIQILNTYIYTIVYILAWIMSHCAVNLMDRYYERVSCRLSAVHQKLTHIGHIPNFITHIYVDFNDITCLPELPEGLIELHCSNCKLTELPPLPASLCFLDCRSNSLTVLPPLPDGLLALYADNNQLKKLPVLPSKLAILSAGNNHLEELPPLPSSITQLLVTDNELAHLPPLPRSLKVLRCCNNELKSLPPIPPRVHVLYASHNPLTTVPEFYEGIDIDMELKHTDIPRFQMEDGWIDFVKCKNYTKRLSMERCITRCKAVKEEIMIRTWAPERVLRLLEAGYDIEDM